MSLKGTTQVQNRLKGEPYPLARGLHLFSDWRHVTAGNVIWHDRSGEKVPLRSPGPMVEAHAIAWDLPQGVAIRAVPAQLSDPIDGPGGTVIHDGGLYRMWLYASIGGLGPGEGGNAMAYAESDDGFAWRQPKLGIIDGGPGGPENLVFSGIASGTGYHGGGVFLDEHAEPGERYKAIFMGSVRGEQARRVIAHFRQSRPDDIDPLAVSSDEGSACMYGATSPDGLHWTVIPDPLILHFSDTANVACYDEILQKYVWYGRINWWYGRRSVGRSESDDFRSFPRPEIVIRSTPDIAACEDWYTNAKTVYPGTKEEHLMFPTQYSRADENGRIYLFSSPDGIHWDRVPGGPVVSEAPDRRFGGRFMGARDNLVPLPGDRVGVLCGSAALPHKYPRREGMPSGQVFWATWPKGRLACTEAQETGAFTTHLLRTDGRKLALNVQTQRAGEVRVEVAVKGAALGGISGGLTQPVPGRSFQDCDPVCADSFAHTVTWRGQADLGYPEGAPIALRFRMRAARIFAFEIQ